MWLRRSSGTQVKSLVKEAVLRWPLKSAAMLSGDGRAFVLAHSWAVVQYLSGKRVRIIDCAVRFDSNALVDELLRYGVDVDEALLSMNIRRAFTPYQILEALHEIDPNLDWANDVFYLLAPFKQFFDGDVSKEEAAYLLHMMNEKIRVLSQQGVTILIVEKSHYSHQNFLPAMFQLRQIVKPLWEIVNVASPMGNSTILRSHGLPESPAKGTLPTPADISESPTEKELFGGIYGTNNSAISESNGIGGAPISLIPPRLAS